MATTTVEIQEPRQIQKTAETLVPATSILKIVDPIRNNYLTYLFLGLTCQSFFANLVFMAVRFSVSSNSGWLTYASILIFLMGLSIPVALALDERSRNQFPKNLICLIAFTTILSIASSLFNLNASAENVWAVCYLTLFSFLFVFVIASAGIVDLSNTVHLYLLSIGIMMILTGIFMVFSFIMDVSVHPIVLSIAFLVLSSIASYIIFESKTLLDSNKVNPTMLNIQELTKTITYIYVSFMYRVMKFAGVPIKEPV